MVFYSTPWKKNKRKACQQHSDTQKRGGEAANKYIVAEGGAIKIPHPFDRTVLKFFAGAVCMCSRRYAPPVEPATPSVAPFPWRRYSEPMFFLFFSPSISIFHQPPHFSSHMFFRKTISPKPFLLQYFFLLNTDAYTFTGARTRGSKQV